MPASTGNAAHASLVFLGIVDFARKPVAEQASLRERLDAAVTRSIAQLEPADRIVADAPDGLAIAVLAAPSEALLTARRVRRLARGEGAEPFELRIGVDHGAIRLAPDDRGDLSLAGDAIATGATIAGFSGPGRILVSRAFRDALVPIDPERAARLHPAGVETDPNLRKHELFSLEGPAGDSDTVAAPPSRRRAFVLAGLAIAGLVGAGFAVRAARKHAEAAAAAAKRPAIVELAIEPWGEVVIDGVHRGRTPPLGRVEVPPGKHTIEIRHLLQPPVTHHVELAAGQQYPVRYSFPTPAAAAPAQQRPAQRPHQQAEQPSKVRRLWNDFRKQAGF